MTTTLFVVQIVLAIFITIMVLLQKSSSIGLGAYSGSNESVFGAKGPAGFLAKFTMFLGLLFVLNTIALSYSYNKQTEKSILDSLPSTQAPTTPQTADTATNPNAFIVDENAAPTAPLVAPLDSSQNNQPKE
ncbi:preprotein translocase subunit SecG [Helicobacter cinaedi PAGU611]|uniref:Protein-export membrane protein SecG n=1 Tax=Helicobacter cinaedi CCUG 18818 = ATCC BAA-847 TaxID=537971 RepID=A0ABN0BD77_9HELI|nr:preprotein translocase subunit SecG [Helicobacter cinaedi]AWK61506.1 preprotein translocase subunit SecG [Helicobacter cinaedi]EFR47602.1 preprotein translocase, SecG subunit [Helicobacter cinaedi CCUG 18818 = ATCC BAA-847]QOQ91420.1 preprotein translocase subunit SecG [Helicobacter cinaedi]QOQ95611.1 preprotein translocase subunit SecG [Helicobacter cinaedi]BAM11931.1 preprotein translocase subunit SecG [Helicobacter cinaedi PAGU611]